MSGYDGGMAGSRKDVRLRLQNAALELYAEHGFDRTTAAEVATLAGVTERTYFRHFSDKREVLFDGEEALQRSLASAVADAPEMAPMPMLLHAFLSVATMFESDRAIQVRRHHVVSATPALRERGIVKLAHLTEVIATALEERNVPQSLALLAATCGMGVLSRVRVEWLEGAPDDYATLLAHAFADLDLLFQGQSLADPWSE
jgi:AcrR family transcriptional regulator